jgi:cytochrome c oxidase subunit 2
MKTTVRAAGSAFLAVSLIATPWAMAEDEHYPPSDAPLGTRLCMTCHGSYGHGSPVVGGPNLTGIEPWYLKRQLENFRAQRRGIEHDYIQGSEMRVTAMALSDADIDQLIKFVDAWPKVQAEATLRGDAQHGSTLYQSCAACHGPKAEGNEALGAPQLTLRNDWYLLAQLKLFKSGYRGANSEDSYGTQMRATVATLDNEADMIDVIAYINSID